MEQTIPNWKQAEELRKQYEAWKMESLKSAGFFPIFNAFKDTYLLRRLSGGAVRLYIFLGLMSNNNTGETWVSLETIAKYFGKTTRTVSSWIEELEKCGLIKRMQLHYNGVAHTFLLPYPKFKKTKKEKQSSETERNSDSAEGGVDHGSGCA